MKTPLVAGLVCAALAVSGCAGRSLLGEKPAAINQPSPQPAAAPVTTGTTPGAPADTTDGAQTTTITPTQKFFWFFSPYRPTIQQGNFISEEMLAQLKVGMTRDQVRFILGTPLLADMFHADRWDYPFRLARGNGETTTSRVTVFFKDGKVERFDGGNLPTEKEYIARIAGPAPVIKKAPELTVAAPVTTPPPPSGPSDPAAAPTPAPIQVTAPAAATPAADTTTTTPAATTK